MAKKKKHPIQRVRKVTMSERDRISTMVIPDKKKVQSKKKCRKKVNPEE